MGRSRKTDLTVDSEAFTVLTELVGEESPLIESRVLHGGKVLFRTKTNVGEFQPLSEHMPTIFRRIDAQHQTVLAKLQDGSLSVQTVVRKAETLLQANLADALSRLATRDFTAAAKKLREIIEQESNSPEARHLLEVARACESGEAARVDVRRRLHAGTKAFAEGSRKRAIEYWKVCLASDPASRTYQCLVLLASTESDQRRNQYAQEIVSLGGQLLTEGYPEEAHALLLVAQTVEQSSLPNPSQVSSSETLRPSTGAVRLAEDRDWPGSEPSDTDPRTPAAAEALRPTTDQGSPLAWYWARVPLPPHYLLAAGACVLVLLIVGISVLSLGGRSEPVELLEQAFATLNAGRYSEATEAYSRILAGWEGIASAHLGRGRARIALGDLEGGLADLTRAVELEPGAPTSAEEVADVLYVRGRYQEAAEYYQRAVDAGSQDPDARYRLASSLVQVNRSDEALDHLQVAIAADPSNGEAHLLAGTLLNAKGRHAEAERELRAARPHINAGGDYFAELGYALLQQDKLDEAKAVAGEFLRFDSGDARSHALLGEVFLHQKEYEPARVELIRALQINAREPRAQIALGRTWLGIGKGQGDGRDLAKARQILETAQGVPEGERLMVLGQVALAEGKVREAVTLLEQSLGIGASESPTRLALAEAKSRAQDYSGAAAELERARLLSSSDPAIPLSLAVAYAQLRDPVRASAEYLKAAQMLTPRPSEPVIFPRPYLSLPRNFDINRSIRVAYNAALSSNPEDPNAQTLKAVAESTSFVIQ